MSSSPATTPAPRVREKTPELERRMSRLRWWNVGVGLVLAVQAVVIAVLTNGFTLPVTATYLTGPPGTAPKLTTLFDVPLGWGVFAFMALSASGAAHSSPRPGVFGWYKRNLLPGPQLRALDRVLHHLVAS